ncbi:MAG TPA: sugar ABC transporter substrate-binding protein, partial [Verrucomicrobiae bacterium]|nr:sugar ABC transporter substrate-binding protein [Verrucomicrobiae bacterium]
MKKIQLLFLALCVATMLLGCGKKENTATSSGGVAPGKKLKLAFVSNNAANFWTIARAGCDAAARELGDVDVN